MFTSHKMFSKQSKCWQSFTETFTRQFKKTFALGIQILFPVWRINLPFEFVNLLLNKNVTILDFLLKNRWINKFGLFLKTFEIFLKAMQQLQCNFSFIRYHLQEKVGRCIVNKSIKRSSVYLFICCLFICYYYTWIKRANNTECFINTLIYTISKAWWFCRWRKNTKTKHLAN